MQTSTEWIILGAVIAVLAVVAIALVSAYMRQSRHADLKRRFGPEYDREVQAQGSVERAERELLAREKRMQARPLHTLSERDRARFSTDWRSVQARFVDDPSVAVREADELIAHVMKARGYAAEDMENFDQRVADLSVNHANVVQHYRAARELADANHEGRANTEELRIAFVHFRALFAEVLEQPQPTSHKKLKEAHV
jgi:hypothetical protein